MLILAGVGCRVDNPQFGVDVSSGGDERLSWATDVASRDETAIGSTRTDDALRSSTEPSTGGASSANTREQTSPSLDTELSVTNPTGTSASTQGGGSGSEDSGLTLESTTSQGGGSDSTSSGEGVDAYCEQGSDLCFVMDRATRVGDIDSELRLESQTSAHVMLMDGGALITETSVEGEVIWRTSGAQGYGTISPNLPMPADAVVGFDLWVRPTQVTDTWFAFGFKNFITLTRNDADKLTCELIINGSRHGVAIDVSFTSEMMHTACVFDGKFLRFWAGDRGVASNDELQPLRPAQLEMQIGRGPVSGYPFLGDMGPLRIWTNLNAMVDAIRPFHPAETFGDFPP